jgi:hypothetical protein
LSWTEYTLYYAYALKTKRWKQFPECRDLVRQSIWKNTNVSSFRFSDVFSLGINKPFFIFQSIHKERRKISLLRFMCDRYEKSRR